MLSSRLVLFVSLFLATLPLLGCERSDDVHAYTAPKEPPQAKPVEWVVPAGWQETRAQQMQFAAFAVDPEHSDAVLSVMPLPRESNALAPNVNRWEGQLGLNPSAPDAVEKMVSHVDVDGAHADVADLAGTNQKTGQPERIVSAIVPHGTLTWFFTLRGPPDVVANQKSNFDGFVRSLKFKGDAGTDPQPAHADLAMAAKPGEGHHEGDGHDHSGDAHAGHNHGPAEPVAERLDFHNLPAGWVEDKTPRQMRAHTLIVEADGKKGEVIVSRFPTNGVGPLLDNINRWRGQVGLEPTTDAAAHVPRDMTVAGTPGAAFEMEGSSKDGQPAKRQIVAMTAQGGNFWFFRFLGPAELVKAQQPAFEKLLADVRFAGVVAPASKPSTQPAGSAP
ncbi:MAG: hypothetical protein WBD40_14490 [Tepidisphaeraceae bacterium]